MIKFNIESKEVELPDIVFTEDTDKGMVFTIKEGPHKDVVFTVSNIQMDDEDECLMHYDLESPDNDAIKEIVNNFLVHTLMESVKYFKEKQECL